MDEGTLLIRADASVGMGTGHVMRCFALAQAWQDSGGKAVFAMVEPLPSVRERLVSEGMEVVPVEPEPGSRDDARYVAGLARQRAAIWVVVDGYHFDADYQRELKAAGLQVLFVDDNGHAGHYAADLVLNQNAHADESLYPNREPYTRLLLGSRYAMLRREFGPWREWKREIPDIGRNVLITMGGSDPENVTLRAIEALTQVRVEGLEAIVVVGGSNPHVESLEQSVSRGGGVVRLQRNAANMPELMAWADIAVSSAGTTSWELAFMSLPTVLLEVAEHQRLVARALEVARAGVNLGWRSETDDRIIAKAVRELLADGPLRKEMAANGRRLVDGCGVGRVLSALVESRAASNA